MQQVQQLTAERTALQGDNDKLKKEVEALKAQVTKLEGSQGALERKAQAAEVATARLNNSTSANAEALERSRVQMRDLVEKFRETADNLKNVEIAKNNVNLELKGKEQEVKSCVDRNVGLYELNSEILAKMEDRGFWSSLGSKEPFTRVARTRLENLIDDYRYRVDELRVERKNAEQAAAGAAAKP
jgi:cell division septum initiation protein DivIVA